MNIRKIQQQDLLACSKLLESAYSLPPYNETFKDCAADLYIKGKHDVCKNNSFVMTNNDNNVIAFIFLNVSSWSQGLQATIEEIVVNPADQNKKVGKKLMNFTINYLKSLNVKSIMIWARKDERLLGFYKNQGFSLADDFVVMFKNL